MKKFQFITVFLLLNAIIFELVRISNPDEIFGILGFICTAAGFYFFLKSLFKKES